MALIYLLRSLGDVDVARRILGEINDGKRRGLKAATKRKEQDSEWSEAKEHERDCKRGKNISARTADGLETIE